MELGMDRGASLFVDVLKEKDRNCGLFARCASAQAKPFRPFGGKTLTRLPADLFAMSVVSLGRKGLGALSVLRS